MGLQEILGSFTMIELLRTCDPTQDNQKIQDLEKPDNNPSSLQRQQKKGRPLWTLCGISFIQLTWIVYQHCYGWQNFNSFAGSKPNFNGDQNTYPTGYYVFGNFRKWIMEFLF